MGCELPISRPGRVGGAGKGRWRRTYGPAADFAGVTALGRGDRPRLAPWFAQARSALTEPGGPATAKTRQRGLSGDPTMGRL